MIKVNVTFMYGDPVLDKPVIDKVFRECCLCDNTHEDYKSFHIVDTYYYCAKCIKAGKAHADVVFNYPDDEVLPMIKRINQFIYANLGLFRDLKDV